MKSVLTAAPLSAPKTGTACAAIFCDTTRPKRAAIWLKRRLEPEPFAGAIEGKGFVAGAVVGHHAGDRHAEAVVIGAFAREPAP